MKIFFSVGEPSGDLHGANLVRQLRTRRPDIECVGFGGPKMTDAGCQLQQDLTQHAVMGIFPVLWKLRDFARLIGEAERYFDKHPPDAVVLIDFPGFNWWVARKAQARGIPVFYYGVPQMWAWASWRVRKLRRLVDHVLCKLPFEEGWFRERGCAATFVGHPYFDELQQQQPDRNFLNSWRDTRPLVTILPGSRRQEVTQQLPELLKAAKFVKQDVPAARFAIASYSEPQAEMARAMVAAAGLDIDVYVGRTAELIQACDCSLACSGSVSLELLYHTKPAAILYRAGAFTFWLANQLVTARFITLVNLMGSASPFDRSLPYDADDPQNLEAPYPEYPTCEDKTRELAAHVVRWLSDEESRQRRVARLDDLKSRYAHPGASARAADYIINTFAQSSPPADRDARAA